MRRDILLAASIVCFGCSAGRDDASNAGPTTNAPTDDAGAIADTGAPPPPDPDAGFAPDTAIPASDADHDGYATADDCDDGDPLVNPGAIEVAGDHVDNDCNGSIDEALVDCDHDLALASTDAMDFARSLGLCQTTKAGATGKERTWGVISASITTTDGKGAPLSRQYGIEGAFGTNVTPRAGKSLAVLSSGVGRTPGQPSYMTFPKGTDCGTNSNVPPAGWPRNTKGCPAPSSKAANDSVVLDLAIRVPTNVRSFRYDFDFYTSEYVEYVCQAYNDTFVALLDTKSPLDPAAAGNISFDGAGDPINVNSGWFQACSPDSWLGRSFACPLGTTELEATGFDAVTSSITHPAQNGATSWLETKQAVVPGEEIRIRFAIWNTGDHWLPSTILLDDWQWSADPASGSSTDRPPR